MLVSKTIGQLPKSRIVAAPLRKVWVLVMLKHITAAPLRVGEAMTDSTEVVQGWPAGGI